MGKMGGELGRPARPILKDPEHPPGVDVLVLESTYGDHTHRPGPEAEQELAGVVERTAARGGRLLVPAFAVGRTQDILLILKEGMAHGDIPSVPVHLDSPMAIDATEIYCRHTGEQRVPHVHEGDRGCAHFFGELEISRTVEQSKALNRMAGPRVIISASGMATGGRILHHLKQRLPKEENTVLFVGYQSDGTRGRRLVDGAKEIKVHGEWVPVRAKVAQVSRVDRECRAWLAGRRRPRPAQESPRKPRSR